MLGVLLCRVELVLGLRWGDDDSSSCTVLIPLYLKDDRLVHGLHPVAGALHQHAIGDLLHVWYQLGCAIAAAQVDYGHLLGLRVKSELRVLRAKQLLPLLIHVEGADDGPVPHHEPQPSPSSPLKPLLIIQPELCELHNHLVR